MALLLVQYLDVKKGQNWMVNFKVRRYYQSRMVVIVIDMDTYLGYKLCMYL